MVRASRNEPIGVRQGSKLTTDEPGGSAWRPTRRVPCRNGWLGTSPAFGPCNLAAEDLASECIEIC